ncbi:DUF3606 domain-containing protein [Ensifer sp. BR816]|uniref:DUF3606 domain-containing protein n=1 Tax=Rhizobium sp. (strain BR816) TaxID=1057002 RepID=UPI000374AB54|nr:DUF3606 domain-containing protein [Ensifer sp. BR816]
MPDGKDRSGSNSEFVSVQEHEVAFLMRTFGISRQEVLEAIREVGPDRDKVMIYLSRK